MACLVLTNAPLGTLLEILTLLVLMSPKAKFLFNKSENQPAS